MSWNDPIATDAAWWRTAVTYQIYVRSFADSDGDGVGDLPGITGRLPYLRDLGVDAVWLTPFYTSPQHDHGYDVADYYDVDPLFGDLDAADRLLATAHDLGLKVIVDLVPNHTSSDHEWFQAGAGRRAGQPRARPLPVPRGAGRGRQRAPQQLAVGLRRAGVDPGRGRLGAGPVVPPPLRHHPARPRLAQPRGLRDVRERAAVLARPGRRRLPGRRRPRPGQGGGPARPARHAHRGPLRRHGRARASTTSRCGTSPRCTTSTAQWRRVLDEYDGDRMAVAEAWTQTTGVDGALRTPRRALPDVQLRAGCSPTGRRPPSPRSSTARWRRCSRSAPPPRGC